MSERTVILLQLKELGIGLVVIGIMVLALSACTPVSITPSSQDSQTPSTLSDPGTLSPTTTPNPKELDGDQTSVVVELDFVPLALYQGGIENLDATAPFVSGDRKLDVQSEASQAYLAYLETQIDHFEQVLNETIPTARIVHRYTVTFGGVSVILPKNELEHLRQLPGVVAVRADKKRYPDGRRDQPES
ncbi:MAG: hypothetical protein GY764_13855 [Halieaceae bacterium]|nr:hypothetical protein [Halieaceae bacterium]